MQIIKIIQFVENLSDIHIQTQQDAIKVLNCLVYINANLNLIRAAVDNRNSGKYYANQRDLEHGVLRDSFGTAFHLNSYSTGEEAVQGLSSLVRQVEHITDQLTPVQLTQFVANLRYDESVGCLEQRIGPALKWAVETISNTIPKLDNIMQQCCRVFQQRDKSNEETLYDYVRQHCTASGYTLCYHENNIVDLTDRLIQEYLVNILGETIPQDNPHEKEKAPFYFYHTISEENALAAVHSENGIAKIIRSALNDPRDNHWGFIIEQLEDPGYARPQRKKMHGTWESRNPDSLFSSVKFPGQLGPRKQTELTKKTPATLLPSDGQIRLISNGVGLLFDLKRLSQQHEFYNNNLRARESVKNAEKSVFRENAGTHGSSGYSLRGNSDFNKIRSMNRELRNQGTVPQHNEIVMRLSKKSLIAVIATDKNQDTCLAAIQKQRMIQNSIQINGHPLDLPILFVQPTEPVSLYTKEMQSKDLSSGNPIVQSIISLDNRLKQKHLILQIESLIASGQIEHAVSLACGAPEDKLPSIIRVFITAQKLPALVTALGLKKLSSYIGTNFWPDIVSVYIECRDVLNDMNINGIMEFFVLILQGFDAKNHASADLSHHINSILDLPISPELWCPRTRFTAFIKEHQDQYPFFQLAMFAAQSNQREVYATLLQRYARTGYSINLFIDNFCIFLSQIKSETIILDTLAWLFCNIDRRGIQEILPFLVGHGLSSEIFFHIVESENDMYPELTVNLIHSVATEALKKNRQDFLNDFVVKIHKLSIKSALIPVLYACMKDGSHTAVCLVKELAQIMDLPLEYKYTVTQIINSEKQARILTFDAFCSLNSELTPELQVVGYIFASDDHVSAQRLLQSLIAENAINTSTLARQFPKFVTLGADIDFLMNFTLSNELSEQDIRKTVHESADFYLSAAIAARQFGRAKEVIRIYADQQNLDGMIDVLNKYMRTLLLPESNDIDTVEDLIQCILNKISCPIHIINAMQSLSSGFQSMQEKTKKNQGHKHTLFVWDGRCITKRSSELIRFSKQVILKMLQENAIKDNLNQAEISAIKDYLSSPTTWFSRVMGIGTGSSHELKRIGIKI